jgi:hypothetical protein
MPTYTFACVSCDNEFDQNTPYDNIENIMCEECGYRTKRVYNFTGMVWSPTRNNGYS